jgi:hypothetical protein
LFVGQENNFSSSILGSYLKSLNKREIHRRKTYNLIKLLHDRKPSQEIKT